LARSGRVFDRNAQKLLAIMVMVCSNAFVANPVGEMTMRRSTLLTAASALLAAALWHLPATAQRAAPPATGAVAAAASEPVAARPAIPPVARELITFDEYRDFRMHDLAQRQARLARDLSAPDLSAAEKTGIERRKAYYDRLAAMPAAERDQLFRARFDKIDTNHDGMLDSAERAAWRQKQQEYYRRLAAERAKPAAEQR
jgi:hypothetical protein